MVHAIGNGNDATVEPNRTFTPNAATRMLPLVSQIVGDIVGLNHAIEAQREQMAGLDSLDETNEHASYQEELADMRSSLSEDEAALAGCIEELSALGVSIHHPIDGSVDFPAVMNRRPVQLCWRPGEETVCYWHESHLDPLSLVSQRHKIDPAKFGMESRN